MANDSLQRKRDSKRRIDEWNLSGMKFREEITP